MRTSLLARSLAYLGGAAFILLMLSASGLLDLFIGGGGGGIEPAIAGVLRKPTPGAGPVWAALHADYVEDIQSHDAGEVSTACCRF